MDPYIWTSVGWPARTYLHQLCADTGCSLEDLLGAMDDRDRWRERERERERVREIHADAESIDLFVFVSK